MSRKSPFSMNLSSDGRHSLQSMARKYTSPYCEVIRAKIILLADEGLGNDVIAARLDTPRQIVSKWRKRFALARLPGLETQPRGGRKARFSPSLVVQVKALALRASSQPRTSVVPSVDRGDSAARDFTRSGRRD
jgi:hypothetical protein